MTTWRRTRTVLTSGLLILSWAAANLTAAAAPPVMIYTVSPGANQQVRFTARTSVESYAGITSDVKGTVRADSDHPLQNPTAQFTVSLASLTTGNGTRDGKMRRDFLETDKYPTATFTMTGADAPPTPPGPLAYHVPVTGTARGTFLLHGVSRPITPVVTVTRERDTQTKRDLLHIVAKFSVRLNDYKIGTPRFLFVTVKQEHPVVVDVWAIASP